MPEGVPIDWAAGGEGSVAALAGIATARVPPSLVPVFVLLSLSPFAAWSVSESSSRDLPSLALSRPPGAGVLFLENRDDVRLANLGEGALELSVPSEGGDVSSETQHHVEYA